MRRPMRQAELIEEMLEFGVDLKGAELVAPLLLPLYNDPRGLVEALKEREPWLALKLGIVQRH